MCMLLMVASWMRTPRVLFSLNVLTNNQLTAADKLTQGKDMGHIIVNAYLCRLLVRPARLQLRTLNGGFGTGITATVAP